MIRPVDAAERKRFEKALERVGDVYLKAWEDDAQSDLCVEDGAASPRLFLVGRALLRDLQELPKDLAPESAGLLLGEFRRESVQWSLEGAYEIGRRTRKGKIMLKEKAAGLFLYGRIVLGESIRSFDRSARPGHEVFVANLRGEVIGVGKLLKALPCRGPAIEPILDRGWYLREGG